MMDAGIIIIYKGHNNEVDIDFDKSVCLCPVGK